jgi:hypothetical protein
MTLEKEVAYFAAHKDEWLQSYEGLFVLVKDEELVGAYASEEEAYRSGLERFGNAPFLIKRVTKEDEETAHFPALVLGLLNAHS